AFPKQRRHLGQLVSANKYSTSTGLANTLNDYPKQNRVAFAIKYKKQNWNKVMFSDETMFQMFRNTQKVFYKNGTQPPSKAMVKHPYKVHEWGAFSVKGPVGFFLFTDIMDGTLHYKILIENFLIMQMLLWKTIGCSNKIMIRSIKLRKPWNSSCSNAQNYGLAV